MKFGWLFEFELYKIDKYLIDLILKIIDINIEIFVYYTINFLLFKFGFYIIDIKIVCAIEWNIGKNYIILTFIYLDFFYKFG